MVLFRLPIGYDNDNGIWVALGPLPWLLADLVYTVPELAWTTRKKCKKAMTLAEPGIRGRMVGMNKLKYWLLVVAALIKVFTPAILLFGSVFVTDRYELKTLFFVLGICTLGWIEEVKLPEKPKND